MLFVGKWAALIPMATLAGILMMVAWNMSELDNFFSVLKGSKSDAAVLITTFGLTVLVDLTVAIEIGMILAAFLFMRKMMQVSSVEQAIFTTGQVADEVLNEKAIPLGVDVFEINGPLFFGAAYKFKDAMKMLEKPAQVLIIRMRNVPVIDATGIRVLREVLAANKKQGTKLILAEVVSLQVTEELKKARLLFQIGKGNIKDTFDEALERANEMISTA